MGSGAVIELLHGLLSSIASMRRRKSWVHSKTVATYSLGFVSEGGKHRLYGESPATSSVILR